MKISELTEITQIAVGDYLPLLDVSDISQGANGSTRKILYRNIGSASLVLNPTLSNNDEVPINQALAVIHGLGGGKLVLKGSQFTISGQINLYDNIEIIADHLETIIYLANNSNCDMFVVNGNSNIRMQGFVIDGNKANQTVASNGINVYGNASNIKLKDIYVKNTSGNGIKFYQCSNFELVSCAAYQTGKTGLTNNGIGGLCVSTCNNFTLDRCIADGCNYEGIDLFGNYDFSIINCKGINTAVEHGTHPNQCYQFKIIGGEYNNNLLDGIKAIDCYRYEVIGVEAIGNSHYGIITASNGGAAYAIKVIGNTVKGNVRGIYTSNATFGTQNDTIIAENTVEGNTQWGIGLSTVNNSVIQGNISKNNQYGVIMSGTCNNNIIRGNRCYDDQGTKTQLFGILDTGSNLIEGNNVTGNKNGGIGTPSATSTIRNNIGYITENSGTGTINSGNTSVVITHGLAATPTLKNISVTLGENPTNDCGNIWVSNITSTQFTINCRNDPGVSNLDLAWRAVIL